MIRSGFFCPIEPKDLYVKMKRIFQIKYYYYWKFKIIFIKLKYKLLLHKLLNYFFLNDFFR